MAGTSTFLRRAPLLAAVTLAALGLIQAPSPAIAADGDNYVQPHGDGGDNAGADRKRDPDVIDPDKDGPYEDGTDEKGDEERAPPGGCQFHNQPLELIV